MSERMLFMNIQDYLKGNRIKEIRIGRSGADVWEINDDTILKHIERSRLEPALFDTYSREALFYQEKAGAADYLPQVLNAEISEDEIILLMKKYVNPDRSVLDDILLRKITRTLARIHTDTVPGFLNTGRVPAERLSAKRVEDCLAGWSAVLDEHPGGFGRSPLKAIAEKINRIIEWHDTEERVLSHGDFHFENLLMDEQGNVLVCDWQGVNLGGASGDLNFFMSRLGADGIAVDPAFLLQAYAEAVLELTGRTVDTAAIDGHMAAANVITSFLFWHQFLHGADTGRVQGIYEKMTGDFSRLEGISDIKADGE